jgi:hypothetical protein
MTPMTTIREDQGHFVSVLLQFRPYFKNAKYGVDHFIRLGNIGRWGLLGSNRE